MLINFMTNHNFIVNPITGFSISFGVHGLNIKVGGGRSECHRHKPLGGSGGMPTLPTSENFQNLEGQICLDMPFHALWQAIL